ncbi:MAG: hypothetical protein QW075_03950 [Thermofilaceae archaeon]
MSHLPGRALRNWIIEPSAAIIDARTGTYFDQAISNFRPTDTRTDGEISGIISYHGGYVASAVL